MPQKVIDILAFYLDKFYTKLRSYLVLGSVRYASGLIIYYTSHSLVGFYELRYNMPSNF